MIIISLHLITCSRFSTEVFYFHSVSFLTFMKTVAFMCFLVYCETVLFSVYSL